MAKEETADGILRNPRFNSSWLRLAALAIPSAKAPPPKIFQEDG
jgi:hypothetical protein